MGRSEAPYIASAVALTPDGRRAVYAVADGTVRVWKISENREAGRFVGHAGAVTGVAVAEAGTRVLSNGIDGTLRLWDIRTGAELQSWKTGGGDGVVFARIAMSPDGLTTLLFADEQVIAIQPEGRKYGLGALLASHPGLMSVAFSPDGRELLAGYRDGRVWRIEVGPARILSRWVDFRGLVTVSQVGGRGVGTTAGVSALAWTPDGRWALVGGEDGLVRLWDVASGRLIDAFEGHRKRVIRLAVSPDGRAALSAGVDGTVRLWRLPTDYTPPPTPLGGKRADRSVLDGADRDQAVARLLEGWYPKGTRKAHGAYLPPKIPPAKEVNARAGFQVPADERILGLQDLTLFGSAKKGFVVGSRGVYFKDAKTGTPACVGYDEFRDRDVRTDDSAVGLGADRVIWFGDYAAQRRAAAELFRSIRVALYPFDPVLVGVEIETGLGIMLKGKMTLTFTAGRVRHLIPGPVTSEREVVTRVREQLEAMGVTLSTADLAVIERVVAGWLREPGQPGDRHSG